MLRSTRRALPAIAAAAAIVGATAPAAFAQTPAPTTPAATTPPIEVATTGAPIAPNGDGVPSPGVNQCYVRLFKPKDFPESLGGEGTLVVQYRLRCSSDVTGFTVSFNREVDGAESELFTTRLADNGIIGDQAFNCAGEFPGWGVSCVGTYKGGYNTVRGLVALGLSDAEVKNNTPFCKLGITGLATTFTSLVARDPYTNKALVNADGTSQIRHYAAGPVRITTPACHRGAGGDASTKKASKKKARRS